MELEQCLICCSTTTPTPPNNKKHYQQVVIPTTPPPPAWNYNNIFQSDYFTHDDDGGGCEENSSMCLNPHLSSIFVLRQLLHFPSSECVELLGRVGGAHPGEWYLLCEPCGRLVSQWSELHHQIRQLQRKLEEARSQAMDKMRKSIIAEGHHNSQKLKVNNGAADADAVKVICARDKVREYFRGLFLSAKQKIESDTDQEHEPEFNSEHIHPPHNVEMDNEAVQLPEELATQEETVAETVSRVRNRRKTTKPVVGFSKVLGRARACTHTRQVQRSRIATLPKELPTKQKDGESQSSAAISKPRKKRNTNRKCGPPPPPKFATPETGIRCDPCDKWYSHEHYPKHVKQRHEMTLKCNLCGYIAEKEVYLERHLKRHEQDPTYSLFKCDKCDFTCSYRRCEAKWSHLQMHKFEDNTVPREDGTLGCKRCSQVFGTKSLLHIHIREVHGEQVGVRCYKCSTCGQGFNSSKLLKTHVIMRHSGDMSYSCDHCGAKFARGPYLREHIKTFHTEGARRNPVVCDLCGKEYPNIRALRTHKRTIHGKTAEERKAEQLKSRQCKHCNVVTPNSSAHKKHLESAHPELFIFQCSKCLSKYTLLKNLLNHEKIAHPPQST